MALAKLKCAALLAGAAMFALESAPAGAASVQNKTVTIGHATTGTSGATDFSSQRRRYGGGRYYGRGRGIGPGVAAGALAAGVIGSAIIASQPRPYYDGYYGGPRYYGGYGYGPGYYDGGW